MTYTPFINCTHCGNEVRAQVSQEKTYEGLMHGVMPLCGCEDSLKAYEREHRIRMEARKRAKRRR